MIRELHIFDFDATLFMSPMHPDDWEGHIGSWYDTLQSLTPPCVVDPSGMWISSTVSAAMESIGNPEVYTVLMTGRGASPELSARVEELIAGAGLSFDEVHLKPGGGTEPWKSSMMKQFIEGMPDLEVVQVWDDRANHLEAFVKTIEGLGLEAIPHFVAEALDTPCELEDPVMESILRSYIRNLLIEVNEYRWDKGSRKSMLLDKKGMAKSDKDNVHQYLRSLGLMEAMDLLNESVEFREVDSPLTYSRASNVKRIAYCDSSVTEPPAHRDAYFKEWENWRKHSKSGKRLKKPVLEEIVPGVSDVCVIGFLDYHSQGKSGDGNTMWYIDYMKTRGDSTGQGVASKLMDQFYETVAQPGDNVNFGKMMRKEIGHLKDKMAEEHPEVKTIGAKYF